jgi:hypothetical protein
LYFVVAARTVPMAASDQQASLRYTEDAPEVVHSTKGKGKGAVPPPPTPKGKGKNTGSTNTLPIGKGAVPPPSSTKGKGKVGKGAVPPAPMKGKGKGKGRGKSMSQEIAAIVQRQGLASSSQRALPAALRRQIMEAQEASIQNATTSSKELGPPIKITARFMDGREIELNVRANDLVLVVKQEISTKLDGLSASRLKLISETAVLHDFQALSDKGVNDGDVLTTIILSPLHGCFNRSGLDVPDDVQEKKMELNEAFAQIANRRAIGVH